jgi:hypothetical protein
LRERRPSSLRLVRAQAPSRRAFPGTSSSALASSPLTSLASLSENSEGALSPFHGATGRASTTKYSSGPDRQRRLDGARLRRRRLRLRLQDAVSDLHHRALLDEVKRETLVRHAVLRVAQHEAALRQLELRRDLSVFVEVKGCFRFHANRESAFTRVREDAAFTWAAVGGREGSATRSGRRAVRAAKTRRPGRRRDAGRPRVRSPVSSAATFGSGGFRRASQPPGKTNVGERGTRALA